METIRQTITNARISKSDWFGLARNMDFDRMLTQHRNVIHVAVLSHDELCGDFGASSTATYRISLTPSS
ncbi:hypothetical protein MKX08_006751 [Trichoderma sp. CBMAI-0020]|nr:hypothetical protein MKX08_006751 [Trichoderma sp. CBMAI-0020]